MLSPLSMIMRIRRIVSILTSSLPFSNAVLSSDADGVSVTSIWLTSVHDAMFEKAAVAMFCADQSQQLFSPQLSTTSLNTNTESLHAAVKRGPFNFKVYSNLDQQCTYYCNKYNCVSIPRTMFEYIETALEGNIVCRRHNQIIINGIHGLTVRTLYRKHGLKN